MFNLNSTWVDVCAPVPIPTDIAAGLTFGDNLMATKNLCNWSVAGLDQKISATAGTCPVAIVLPATTFKELHFENNISVSVDAACKATIKGLDQKVAGTMASCGLTNIVGNKDFKTLKFANNLGIEQDGADACDFVIKGLDQKIKAENGKCGQGDVDVAIDFTELNFSDNIGLVMGAGVDACKATIKGLDQNIQATNKTIGVTNCIAAVPIPAGLDFTLLDFLENIEVVHDAVTCKASIKGLDQKIEGTWAPTDPACGAAAAAEDNFKKLIFADNTIITNEGLCSWKIKGLDQKIEGTWDPAEDDCGAEVVAKGNFKHIKFADNTIVTDDGECVYTVKGLDQKIQGTWVDVPCEAVAVPLGNFKKIVFGDNTFVTDNDSCEYTVKGLDQKIEGTWVDDKCGNAAAVGVGNFKHLKFADNTILTNNTDCSWTIKGLDQKIQGTWAPDASEGTCGAAAVGPGNFKHLKFGDNTIVTDGEDCTWTIKGLDQKIQGTWVPEFPSSACGAAPASEGNFKKIVFGDNTIVTKNEDCVYTVKGLDQKIKATAGPCVQPLAAQDFRTLDFSDGLLTTDEGGCTYKIKKVLKFTNNAAPFGPDSTCEVDLGCGILGSSPAAGKVKLELDNGRILNPLTEDERSVTVVTDICCLGNGFEIKTRTMTFNACGLLNRVTEDDPCDPVVPV